MWLWLFDCFFGRIVVTAVCWIIGGLVLSDDPKASSTRSGRTTVKAVLRRYIFMGSIPVWGFFLLFGFPWVSLPGEIKTVHGMPTQTESGYAIDIVFFFCVWYAGWVGAFVIVGFLSTGTLDFIFRNDSEHQRW